MRSDGKKRESLKNDTPRGEWVAGGRRARGMDEFGLKLFRICPEGDKGRRREEVGDAKLMNFGAILRKLRRRHDLMYNQDLTF